MSIPISRCLFVIVAIAISFPALAQDLDTQADAAYLARVMAILKEVPLIDGHNDIPWAYRNRAALKLDRMDLEADLTQLERPTHTDIPRLRAGGMGGQFWSVFIPITRFGGGDGDAATVLEQIDFVHRMVDHYSDTFEIAYTADDVIRIHKAGKIASMMGMEGGHSMQNSLGVLRMLYRAGARYMTLTHGKSTFWADSATDEPRFGGLTEFGEEVVREMNRIGMLVDLSHVSPDTMRDTLDVAVAPVIFSHSSAKTLCAHPRNVPDDVLERLPKNGGVIMITFLTSYVSQELYAYGEQRNAERDRLREAFPDPADAAKIQAGVEAWSESHPRPQATLEQVADHIDHVRKIAGIDHIGLGGDYDGMGPGPVGLEDVSCYPALFVELLKRGYSDDDIKKVAGLNVLRAWGKAEAVARKLQSEREASDAALGDYEEDEGDGTTP